MKVISKLCDLPVVGGYIALFVAILPFAIVFIIKEALEITAISDAQLISLGGVLVLGWNYFVVRHQGLNIVLPIIPIPFWIVGIIWVFIGTWYTYDALRVSFFDPNSTPFTIKSVEKHGVGDNRFIRITDAMWGNQYVYEYDENTERVKFVVFPIVSQSTWSLLSNKKPATIRVLVKKDADTTVKELDAWVNKNCAMDDKVIIEGIIRIGFDSIDDETKSLIQSAKLKLHDNFILIEEGVKPSPLIISILLFLISIGGIILSFFVVKVRLGETPTEETA